MKNMGAFCCFCTFLFLNSLHAKVQSTFKGPVELKVWQHWQQSWNVEDVTQDHLFEFERGFDEEAKPLSTLKFKTELSNLEARIQCETYVPKDMWSMHTISSEVLSVKSQAIGLDRAFFEFENAPCTDEKAVRIVRKIHFKIINDIGEEIYSYTLIPMYVRSKDQNYWNNPIPAYSAHAGSGDIAVSNWISDGSDPQSDTWGDIRVSPTLNFVDLNFMKKDSKIGLHRHERNQEAYLILEGQATMLMGVAAKVLDSEEKVMRQWSLAPDDVKEVTQFTAQGGWIESRTLNAAELSVIVPHPSLQDTVYFHGINAVEDTRFFTMGTKN